MIKVLIFDCFGVLIGDGLERVLRQHEINSPGIRQRITPIVSSVNTGKLDPAVSGKQMAEALGLDHAAMDILIKEGELVNTELLSWILEQKEHYKIVLLTNISRPSLEKRFTKSFLSEYFDLQVVSGEQGIEKPNPKIYQYIFEQMDVLPNECVFMDDRQNYLTPASKLGIHTILFKDNEQFFSEITQYLA